MKKRSKFLAVISTAALVASIAVVPGKQITASNGELTFIESGKIEMSIGKEGKAGKAQFLIDTADVKIPSGLKKKLEAIPEGHTLFVVQFDGPITNENRESLNELGVEIGDYVPDYAFIVDSKGVDLNKITSVKDVSSVTPYLPLYKFDPKLFDQGASKFILAVLYDLKGNQKEVAAKGLDELIQYSYKNDVMYISLKPEFKLMNDEADTIIGVTTSQNNYGLSGSGQTVGVADTGLDTGKNDSSMHEAFQGKITALYALGRTGDASDPHGHGTHVAGSVLGNGSMAKGMAPGASLVFQSVMDDSGGLGGLPSNLNTLFSQAYNAGARIHTNSWGAAVNGAYTSSSQQVDQYVWNNDMTILFAAGNEGPQSQTISSPGTAKNAITVGATENDRPEFGSYADNINEVASFSSRGPTSDGRVKPDVTAPGTYILSARSSLASDSSFWATYNSKYAYMGGTSMATPIVAGSVALLREHYMENRGVTPKPSLLKASLIAGATDIGASYYDQGWGRVALDKSLNVGYVNETRSLSTGQTVRYSFTADGIDDLKISLVWTDYPGNPSATYSLVNDLDLVVTTPSGQTYIGNDFSYPYNNNWDGVNNVENVFFNGSESGTYIIEIQAYNVPSGSQDFSIAVVN